MYQKLKVKKRIFLQKPLLTNGRDFFPQTNRMNTNTNIYLKNIDKEIIIDALDSSIKDFEDAVQVFAAEYNEIEAIITRNKRDFQGCDLEVLSPKELIHKIVK